ncbi:unnamed protein product [Sphenostylis stenocarpa]|uniref:Uncharacterized protein n=1 Tax=Sphenostylis stenocarpa TaxID=92480 RepID=A0AA86VHB0_9FABA|nr:unnamed protein product [Sphenostylis stenocarpa]
MVRGWSWIVWKFPKFDLAVLGSGVRCMNTKLDFRVWLVPPIQPDPQVWSNITIPLYHHLSPSRSNFFTVNPRAPIRVVSHANSPQHCTCYPNATLSSSQLQLIWRGNGAQLTKNGRRKHCAPPLPKRYFDLEKREKRKRESCSGSGGVAQHRDDVMKGTDGTVGGAQG